MERTPPSFTTEPFRGPYFVLIVAISLVLLRTGALPAQGTDGLSAAVALEQSLTQLIEQTEPSVVSVARLRPPAAGMTPDGRFLQPGLDPAAMEPRDILPNQFAAGVLVAPAEGDERFVLTVYHAVKGGAVFGVPGSGDGSQLEVRLASRHTLPAAIVAADPRSDLAILKLDLRRASIRMSDLRPVSWRDSPRVRKGQLVVTLGNPYWIARDGSASAGWAMVANLARRPVALSSQPTGPQTLDGLGSLIHLDTRLPIGSSGAAIINLTGQLVGISTSLAAIDGYDRSAGFALPVDSSTRWIIESLLAGQEVEYGFLGISPRRVQPLPAEISNQPSAALAETVHPQSPAAIAGMRRGDVVLEVDGQPVLSDLDLMRLVTLHPPETVVRLKVARAGGETLTLSVKLGKWPASDDDGIIATQKRWPVWRGLGVDYPTGRAKFLGQLSHIQPGVLVAEVQPGSTAEAAMLEPGVFISHVERTAVRTPAEFAAAVQGKTEDVNLRVIAADDTTRVVTIRP